VAILAGGEVRNACNPFSQGTQHCETVGNGFVTGQAYAPGKSGRRSYRNVHEEGIPKLVLIRQLQKGEKIP